MSKVEYEIGNLLAFSRNITEKITNGLQQAGQHIHDLAKELAPLDTGELKESGKVEVINPMTIQVSFGNDLNDDRAVAQEFGTSSQPAQPYLIPATNAINVAQEVAKKLQ